MNMMRVVNVLALLAGAGVSAWFLIGFRSIKGAGDVAAMLRLKELTIGLLISGPLLVNLLNLGDPLTTTTGEQIFTLATRLFAVASGVYGLVVWLRRRRTPVQQFNRRHDDPK